MIDVKKINVDTIKKFVAQNKKRSAMTVVIIAVVVAGLLLTKFTQEQEFKKHIVKVSGNIEGTEVRISFRVQGRIEELLTDEGMFLREGDMVARLETDELSKIKAEREAMLKASEFKYKLAADNYTRARNLYEAGSISDQDRETAKIKAEAAGAYVGTIRASLELANTRLGFTYLDSPLNGFVLAKCAEKGEVVQVGAPVFTALDLNNIWVTAYINESDLGKVKLNQRAYVMTDSFSGKRYDGWVSFVSQEAEFTPKYIQTTEERVKLVYRIKVRVDNSSLDLKAGMPADAYILR